MPLVGFEPTIPAFEQAKTFHALDSAATVISPTSTTGINITTTTPTITRIYRHFSHVIFTS
jgi:hypothetical protein